MFKNYTNFIFAFTLVILLINGCTKDVEPDPVDQISGRTVRYTVLVISGANSTSKSTQSLDSAIVTLVMNDSIYSIATDANGLATFNNLAAGVVAVTVDYPNYTRVNMIVDLSMRNDSIYDADNLRNASTMVALFPLTGEGTTTIRGRLFADLNLTMPGMETVPEGTKVSTFIEGSQLENYINHTGDGEILSIAYEDAVHSAITDNNGDYSIVVPASASGLTIVIQADDFVYNQIDTGGNPQRKTFHAGAGTITALSGLTIIEDITYDYY